MPTIFKYSFLNISPGSGLHVVPMVDLQYGKNHYNIHVIVDVLTEICDVEKCMPIVPTQVKMKIKNRYLCSKILIFTLNIP